MAASVLPWTTYLMEHLLHIAERSAGYQKVGSYMTFHMIKLTVVSAGDGVFATNQHGTIALVDLKSNTTTTLVALNDVRDVSCKILLLAGTLKCLSQESGAPLEWSSWELSSDMKYILIKSDNVKVSSQVACGIVLTDLHSNGVIRASAISTYMT